MIQKGNYGRLNGSEILLILTANYLSLKNSIFKPAYCMLRNSCSYFYFAARILERRKMNVDKNCKLDNFRESFFQCRFQKIEVYRKKLRFLQLNGYDWSWQAQFLKPTFVQFLKIFPI